MASVSGVQRTIIIPYGGEGDISGNYDIPTLLTQITTLVASTANLLVTATIINREDFFLFTGGSFHYRKGIKVILLCTPAGDAALVANLPAFQTAVGVTISTWSETITYGF